MMRPIYCANCGTRINVKVKALPVYGTTVVIAEYHECLDEPIELDLTPIEIPSFETIEGKDKFVQKLDNLPKPAIVKDTGDRRSPDQVKSSAPQTVFEQVRGMLNTTPARDISEEPEDA